MENKCILTGNVLNEDGSNSLAFKRMCLNCKSCKLSDNGTICDNQKNMEDALERIKAAVSGYEIEDVKLKPLPLKDDTKKCKNWEVDQDRVLEYVLSKMP